MIPTSDHLEEALVRLIEGWITREILYELQTGGGIALGPVAPGQDRAVLSQLATIRELVTMLRAASATAPDRLAARLGGVGRRVLDIGAGEAPWSLAFAAHSADVRVTAVDLPEQIPALHEAIAHAGRIDQYQLVATDVFVDDLRLLGRFDIIIVANVFHLFDEHRCAALLNRIVPLLDRHGVLAIIDQVFEEAPNWNRWAALYAIGVLHGAPGGHLHPARTYDQWLDRNGLSERAMVQLCPLPPLTVIMGRHRG